MNTPRVTIRRLSRLTLLLSGLAIIAYMLYFHQLGSLVPGYNAAELKAFQAASDWHLLLQDPVNIFYKAPLWLLTAILHHGLLMTRVVAAIFGIGMVLLFFTVAKLRFSYWLALLATFLFATCSGFLHTARLGTPQVLQMGILAFMAALLWYRARTTHRYVAGYLVVALTALLWYVPGMLWLELCAVIILWPSIKLRLTQTPSSHLTGWALIFVAIIAPLIAASILRPHVALEALGLPIHWPSILQYGHNLLNAILSLGFRSSGEPNFWVGHAPLLNVIEVILVCIGLYERIVIQRNFRSMFAICSVLIGLLLIAFGGPMSYAVVVPLLYLFVIEGVSQLLKQWFAVFPRNPIAKGFGLALVLVMLAFSVTYHIRSYFVAWPHNEATQQSFRIKAP